MNTPESRWVFGHPRQKSGSVSPQVPRPAFECSLLIVMFDLLFIVFDSANLSLAFDTLYDVRWSCRSTEVPISSRPSANVLVRYSIPLSLL
jgi:hypothetical protein